MSTHATIAIKNEDGSVDSIYCHHDGYMSHCGSMLSNHYTTPQKVRELIELGDMSSLGETIEDSVFYCRDRGEDLNIGNDASIEDFLGGWRERLTYIYISGKWFCIIGGEFVPVEDWVDYD